MNFQRAEYVSDESKSEPSQRVIRARETRKNGVFLSSPVIYLVEL